MYVVFELKDVVAVDFLEHFQIHRQTCTANVSRLFDIVIQPGFMVEHVSALAAQVANRFVQRQKHELTHSGHVFDTAVVVCVRTLVSTYDVVFFSPFVAIVTRRHRANNPLRCLL